MSSANKYIIPKYIKYIDNDTVTIDTILGDANDAKHFKLAQTFDYIDETKLNNLSKDRVKLLKQIISVLFREYKVCNRNNKANGTIFASSPVKAIVTMGKGELNYPEENCSRIQIRPMMAANYYLTDNDGKTFKENSKYLIVKLLVLYCAQILNSDTLKNWANEINPEEEAAEAAKKAAEAAKKAAEAATKATKAAAEAAAEAVAKVAADAEAAEALVEYLENCISEIINELNNEGSKMTLGDLLLKVCFFYEISVVYVTGKEDESISKMRKELINNINTTPNKNQGVTNKPWLQIFTKANTGQDEELQSLLKKIVEIKDKANEAMNGVLNPVSQPGGGKRSRKKPTKKPSPYTKTHYKHTDKYGVERVEYTKGAGKYVRVMNKEKKMVYKKVG